MTALFGIVLFAGVVMLLAWIVATSLAETVEGREHTDPESRFGVTGRSIIAVAVGFGMAGMSSLYAGWPVLASLVAAVVGAVGLVAVGFWLGPQRTE